MPKVILIYANCHNPDGKGDFAFAGNVARDMVREFQMRSIDDVDVILVSTLDGMPKFYGLYGPVVNGRLKIEGVNVGISSLETFDPVENTVLAFIDANPCKSAASDTIKRVLGPESRFIFLGNLNQPANSGLYLQTLYRLQIKKDQPGLYDFFSDDDILIGSAGLGPHRFGITTITKADELPVTDHSIAPKLPNGSYGFMYLVAKDYAKDYKIIAQYIKLSGHDEFVLVGEFEYAKEYIESAFLSDTTLSTPKRSLPPIRYFQSLSNGDMRHAMANTGGVLVASTGVNSTLEAMRDKKLTYYQDMAHNVEFVSAYLLAVESIVSDDQSFTGLMPQLVIELSSLLFANKPLVKKDMERTHELLQMSSVCSKLTTTNQTILDQAAGKIAPRLLGFLNSKRNTQDQVQLATVCALLRKPGEMGSPVYDQALRRAATWGRLFELKVLIKSMSTHDLDKKDPLWQRTALHWAVINKSHDCARALIKAGASLDFRDKEGQTPLHSALINSDKPMIELLIKAGASVDSLYPVNKIADEGVLLFVRHCLNEADTNRKRSFMTI